MTLKNTFENQKEDISSVYKTSEVDWRVRIFDALSFPSVVIGRDMSILGINEKFKNVYDLDDEDVVGKKCFEVFLYKLTPCNSDDCAINRVFKEKKIQSYTLKHHYKWEERVFSPILDFNGEVLYIIFSIRDITRTKSLEYQLIGVKEFMTQVIYSSASAIVAANRQGKIELMNSVARELFGDDPASGRSVKHTEQLYPEGKAKEIMRMLRDEKIGGKGKLLIPKTLILNGYGEEIEVEMSAAIIYDNKGTEIGTMAIYNDLRDKFKVERELKEAQKQLAISEKMASLGQLAAGVAHEINNPLTGVLFYASLLLERSDIKEDVKEDIACIVEDADRCKNIVKSLLVYSRSTGTNKRIVHINEIVEQSLRLIRDQKKFRNIEIKKYLIDEMMLINADTNKLNQVLINLIINAADSIEEFGTISFYSYKNKHLKKVYLEIVDTGKGIPREHLPKIFDPFFTTKEVGKSTGLGLSIVYGIIEEHGGSINVKKTGEKGTTFIIELPLYTSENQEGRFCVPSA